jgi:hypothetical protein
MLSAKQWNTRICVDTGGEAELVSDSNERWQRR